MKICRLLSVSVFSIFLIALCISCTDYSFAGGKNAGLGASLLGDLTVTIDFDANTDDTDIIPPSPIKKNLGSTVLHDSLPKMIQSPSGKKFNCWLIQKSYNLDITWDNYNLVSYSKTDNDTTIYYQSFTSFTINGKGDITLLAFWEAAPEEPDNPENPDNPDNPEEPDPSVSIDGISVEFPQGCIKLTLEAEKIYALKYNISITNLDSLNGLTIENYYWFLDGNFIDTTTYNSKTLEVSDFNKSANELYAYHEVLLIIYIDESVAAYGKVSFRLTE